MQPQDFKTWGEGGAGLDTFVAVSACKAFRDGKLMRLPPRTLTDRTSRSHGPPSRSHHHSSESVVPEMDLDLCTVDNDVPINILAKNGDPRDRH